MPAFEPLRVWWDLEPEYTQEEPATEAEYRAVYQAAFFDLLDALGRRGWTCRLEWDDMWIATILGEGGMFATPCQGLSVTTPVHFGLTEALCEAYLKALTHPSNRGRL